MIDLALWRRITRTSDGRLIISTTPTGHPVADKMLAHIDRHPGGTTRDILAKAPGRMSHLLHPADANRHWYSRTPQIPRHEIHAERQRLDRAVAGDIDSPRTAALALLANALRIVELTEPQTVLGECGEVAWIVEECVDYLLLVRYRFEVVSAAGSAGGSGG